MLSGIHPGILVIIHLTGAHGILYSGITIMAIIITGIINTMVITEEVITTVTPPGGVLITATGE